MFLMINKRLVFLFFIFCLVGPSFVFADNLIHNGDFANGLSGWKNREFGGDFSVQVDSQIKHQERNCVRIACQNSNTQNSGNFYNDTLIEVQPGKIYQLSCFIKGENIKRENQTFIVISLNSSGGTKAVSHAIYSSFSSFPTGTFDWQEFTYYIGVPEGVDKLRIYFSGHAGTIWYSNLKLTPLKTVSGITYQVKAPRITAPAYGDVGENALTDGIVQEWGNAYAFLVYSLLPGGTAINLELPRLTKIEKVLVFLRRINDDHKLKTMEVYCDMYGQLTKIGEVAGYWEPTAQRLFTLEAPIRQNTKKLSLQFFGGGYLSIAEVVIVEEEL